MNLSTLILQRGVLEGLSIILVILFILTRKDT